MDILFFRPIILLFLQNPLLLPICLFCIWSWSAQSAEQKKILLEAIIYYGCCLLFLLISIGVLVFVYSINGLLIFPTVLFLSLCPLLIGILVVYLEDY